MKVLVTGGAGYIGGCIAAALLDAGDEPVLLDDLSRGPAALLTPYPAYIGDVADAGLLSRVFADHPDIAVTIHCAARTVVSESVDDPVGYYRVNVAKTIGLVEALLANGCHRLVFSSSAAVYGDVTGPCVTETTPLRPASPYARSKIMIEELLADVCRATPLRALSLRYFNPIGADPKQRCGPYERMPSDVIGSLVAAWERGRPFRLNGSDWPTADGTPLRDFVHVRDVAEAHVAAVRHWIPGPRRTAGSAAAHRILNIGSGHGTTVRQLADTFNRCVDRPVAIVDAGRRAGDTVGAYADTTAAERLLGWRPGRTVTDAVLDTLAWAACRDEVLGRVPAGP